MAIPDDVTRDDSLKHMMETLNESLATLRTYEGSLDYKARGTSMHIDFAGGWEGTPFKVYQNGKLPYGTNAPAGRSGSVQTFPEDLYRLTFEPYTAEPLVPGVSPTAVFVLDDFGADAYAIGAYIAPGWGMSDEGEGLTIEVRFKLRDVSADFTVGLFGNPTGYDKPLFEPAVEGVAPTHDDFIGMWFSSLLTHTSWRKMQRTLGTTNLDAYMTGASIDTLWHTFRMVKLVNTHSFEFFFDGVSKGTFATPGELYAPYAFGFISGGSNLAGGFELDYLRVEHDLNISTRP